MSQEKGRFFHVGVPGARFLVPGESFKPNPVLSQESPTTSTELVLEGSPITAPVLEDTDIEIFSSSDKDFNERNEDDYNNISTTYEQINVNQLDAYKPGTSPEPIYSLTRPKPKPRVRGPRDPDAPKPPQSAYIRWMKDVRLLVQQELGNPSFSELNRELGYRWRNIDENTKGWYTWLAEKDNVEYRKAMQIYTNSPRYLHLKEQAKIKKMLENPPKIPPSAYTLWVKDNKETVKADLKPNSSCHLMSSELGKRWKNLDLETKQYYCRLAGQKKKDFYSQQNHLPSPSLPLNSLQEYKVPELFYKEATMSSDTSSKNLDKKELCRTLHKDMLEKEKSSSGLRDHVKADENNPEKSSKSVQDKVSSPEKTTSFKHRPMIKIARNLYQNPFSNNSDLHSSNSSVRPNPVLVEKWSQFKDRSSVQPNPVLVEEWSKAKVHSSVRPYPVLVEEWSKSKVHSFVRSNPAIVGQRFQSKSHPSVRPNPELVEEWSKSKAHCSVQPNPVLVEESSKSKDCSVQPNPVLVEESSKSKDCSGQPNPVLVEESSKSKAHCSVQTNLVLVEKLSKSEAHSSVRPNPALLGQRFQSNNHSSIRSNPVIVGKGLQSKAHSSSRPNPVLDVERFEPKAPETADEVNVYSPTIRITDEEGNMIFHPRIFN